MTAENSSASFAAQMIGKGITVFGMNETNSSTPDYLNDTEVPQNLLGLRARHAAISAVIILCFLSSIINACIVTLSRRIRGNYGTVLRLSFGLAAADCWTSIIIGVGFMVYSLGFLHGVRERECIELFIELFRMGGIFTSILHLVLLALNHYQSIEVHHTSRVVISGKLLTFLMITSWIGPPISFFLCFFMVPGQGFSTIASAWMNSTSAICKDDFVGGMSYRVTIYTLLLIPVMLMICLYLNMIRTLYILEKQFQQQNRRSRSVRMKRKMLVTIVLMIGSFVVGWIPSGTWLLVLANDSPYKDVIKGRPLLLFGVSYVVNLLMVLKFFINPLIYALRIPEINHALRYPFSKPTVATSGFSKSKGSHSPNVQFGGQSTKLISKRGSDTVRSRRNGELSHLSLQDCVSDCQCSQHPETTHL